MPNTRQHKVDKFLSELPAEQYERFMSLCGHNRNVVDLYRYLQTIGYTGSVDSCYSWFNAAFPAGTVARRINQASGDTVGVDLNQMLVHRATRLYLLIHKVEEQVSRAQLTDKDAALILSPLCREMRSMIAFVEDRQFIKDRDKLIKAGADRALREVEQVFKDQPIEAAVKKATDAAWEKIEEELKN